MRDPNSTWTCHLCQQGEVAAVPGYENFLRVRSDCRPWRRGGALGVCRSCASVVKAVDDTFEYETAEIYASYDIFHQSDGSEQRVYSRDEGEAQFRSDPLVEKIRSAIPIADRGTLLDVGCGKGAFLEAWSRALPDWDLEGSDLDAKAAPIVEAIPGVRAMHTGELTEVKSSFDVISMVHVLEHVPRPIEFLRTARERLNPGGTLFVEVPHYEDRAFDLLVADHCSHFTNATLRNVAHAAGLASIGEPTATRHKDTGGVFHRGDGTTQPPEFGPSFRETFFGVQRCLLWLHRTLALARRMQERGTFGIFGTSIGATWLASTLARPVDFFVDEDPSRQGRLHLGKPILGPTDVPTSANVFMCLSYPMAQNVEARLSRSSMKWRAGMPAMPA